MTRSYVADRLHSRLWRLRHNTARPHIVATDETQPIEPLLVAEPHAVALVGHTAPPGGYSSAITSPMCRRVTTAVA